MPSSRTRRVRRTFLVGAAAVGLVAAPAVGIAAERDTPPECPHTGISLVDRILELGCATPGAWDLLVGTDGGPNASPAVPTPTDPRGQVPIEQRFVQIYDELEPDGTEAITEAPHITGDTAADKRIRQIAEERGYVLRRNATAPLVDLEGEQLQPEAAEAWLALRHDAAEAGHDLALVSAHRDVATQRAMFVHHLNRIGVATQGSAFTAEQLAGGGLDEVIDEILATSSIPGYSKHHDGYTIDIKTSGDGVPMTSFGTTEAFEWLSADDYAVARRYGFLPSYPDGVDGLGPDPEEWEYVWVGTELAEG